MPHTRWIDGLLTAVAARQAPTRALQAGNVYVNRRTTGARVGVEPFGGMRMSGTGPKAGGLDYLWAFVRRTDAPLEQRLATAQAARRELGRPQRTVPAAGQRTELRYDTPRGLGLLCARGDDAPWWLAAALLAGNAVALFDSPGLAPVVEALHEAGVPDEALRGRRGRHRGDARPRAPAGDRVRRDRRWAGARALYRLLGPTLPGQRSLKALLSTLDGPQAGEPGFLRRFAWPKVAAVRTLRHGADLPRGRPGAGRGGPLTIEDGPAPVAAGTGHGWLDCRAGRPRAGRLAQLVRVR